MDAAGLRKDMQSPPSVRTSQWAKLGGKPFGSTGSFDASFMLYDSCLLSHLLGELEFAQWSGRFSWLSAFSVEVPCPRSLPRHEPSCLAVCQAVVVLGDV